METTFCRIDYYKHRMDEETYNDGINKLSKCSIHCFKVA